MGHIGGIGAGGLAAGMTKRETTITANNTNMEKKVGGVAPSYHYACIVVFIIV